MVWVIDDLAEAAAGPWGLAVSLGVGVLSAVQRSNVTPTASTTSVGGGASTAAPPDGTRAGTLATARSVADGVKQRIQATLADAGDYWRELYAEAHDEWERGRRSQSAAVTGDMVTRTAATPQPSSTVPTDVPIAVATDLPAANEKRVRGPNGRYVKEMA